MKANEGGNSIKREKAATTGILTYRRGGTSLNF